MKTEAYFENIKQVITRELSKATSSILVAVAWFTDNSLFEILCKKARDGVNVEIIITNDEINSSCRVNHKEIELYGGKIYFGGNDETQSIMHNKFCIIDLRRTITGSYNWSKQASYNRENITITDDPALAEQFARYFYQIKNGKKYFFHEQTEKEITNLSYYLKKLSNLTEKEKFNELNEEVFIIKNLDYIDELVLSIIILCENKQWMRVIEAINNYLHLKQQVVLFEDLEIKALQYHKKSLESKLDKLVIRKNEIEKEIFQFTIIYNQRLGKQLLRLIELKKKYYPENHEEYKETKEKINSASSSSIKNIDEEEKELLKKIYRKAALICHPDKFNDEKIKEEAKKIFQQLNIANNNNDLLEVKRIYENLIVNNFFISGKKYDSTELLKKEISKLLFKINELNFDIRNLEITPMYQIITNANDWELFYKLEEEKIILEINKIENEFSKKTFTRKKKR